MKQNRPADEKRDGDSGHGGADSLLGGADNGRIALTTQPTQRRKQ